MRCKMLLAAFPAVALLMGSCHHKNLEPYVPTSDLQVVFDWTKAPDAKPASMAFYLYRDDGTDYTRYMFDNAQGGYIRAAAATYHALCLNSDNTDWARVRNEGSASTFELYTLDASELSAQGLRTDVVPRARGAEDERVAATPGMLWGSATESIRLSDEGGHQIIRMYPEEKICHYTVDVVEVENATSVSGGLDATLSGMAQGYMHGLERASETPATMAFTLQRVADSDNSLHAEFLTFGECPTTEAAHTLTIYVVLRDGRKQYFTVDVADQIRTAADPKHVHIVVRGLKLPKIQQGGFHPHVKDWEHVEINLNMGQKKQK